MLSMDKLYTACNKYNWCTYAINQTYDKILHMPSQGYETKEIAIAIWAVSNEPDFNVVFDKLKSLSRSRY